MIDTRIKTVVQFHYVLHLFFAGRSTETVIIELKLALELSSVDQDPLFLVFIDLIKAYNNLDRGRILKTIMGYGAGPKLRQLLAEFWSRQKLVTCKNGFHGPQLQATRGMTHGWEVLLKLLNMAIDSMVRHWISPTVEDKSTTNDGLGMAVGRCMWGVLCG